MKTFSKKPAEKKKKKIPCPVCCFSEYTEKWGNDKNHFVKCSKCKHIYQNPQPVEKELIERYDSEYFEYEICNENVFFNLIMLGLEDIDFFKKEKEIFKIYEKSTTKPAFLDVGCATGRLLEEMSKKGWDAKGVEVCKSSAKYGIEQRNLDIKIGTIDEAGFEDQFFDVIHCSHLIEHLTDPSSFVSKVFKLLKTNGIFIITTPDVKGFQAQLFGHNWRSAIADHMQLFSYKSLKRLLEENGFAIERKVSWGGLAQGTSPVLIKKIADKLVKKMNCGDVMEVMARKQ